METTAPELCRLLIDCLKRDEQDVDPSRLSCLSPECWRAFLGLAAAQRVRPLLWHRLRQKGLERAIPLQAAEELRAASRWNTLHNLRLYGELCRLLAALKPQGIPSILLKGICLSLAVYSDMGLREMNDIDLLVRPADLSRLAGVLEDQGYRPLQRVDPGIVRKTAHHLPRLVKPGLSSIEIHWNLSGPGESYSIDPGILWERAAPVHIAGCDALILSAEDLLLHLCLHASYLHQFTFGLRPFCDIAETIARFGSALSWQTITELAAGRGWQRGAYLALLMANELAGADIPADILEKLRPVDMTEAVRETVRTQIFTDTNFAFLVPVPFAELLGSRRLLDKILIFWQRVFLPKTMIAALYSVPVDSVRIYGCYPRRLIDVLRRHKHTLKRYQQDDAPLKTLVERKNLIANWLSQ